MFAVIAHSYVYLLVQLSLLVALFGETPLIPFSNES